MVDITLYYFAGDNRLVDKSGAITSIRTSQGTFKYPCSVYNPVVEMFIPTGGTPALDLKRKNFIKHLNYAYIQEFDRYYYITDRVMINSKLVRLYMKVDVLYSFATALKSLPAYVSRSASSYNKRIADNMRPYELIPQITEIVPYFDTSGGISQTKFTWDDATLYNFYITTYSYQSAGSGSSIAEVPPYPSITDMPSYESHATSIDDMKSHNVCDYWSTVYFLVEANQKPTTFGSYVGSIVAMPFSADKQGSSPSSTGWYVGGDTEPNPPHAPIEVNSAVNYYKVYRTFSSYLYVASFTFPSSSDFLDYEPYTTCEFYFPFIGYVAINLADVRGKRVLVYYIANYEDGSATAYAYALDPSALSFDPSKAKLIYSHDCQLGISVPITSNNQEELKAMLESARISAVIGGLGSALQVVAGVASQNPMMIAGGALSATKTIAGYAETERKALPSASVTISNGSTGKISPTQFRYRLTQRVTSITDESDYQAQNGLPLEDAVSSLSSLTGMTRIHSIKLDGISASEPEKTEILRLLREGVIL